MSYSGVVKGKFIQLEDEAALPEGMRVSVIPKEQVRGDTPASSVGSLKEWLEEARQIRAQLPMTSDSVGILRQLRDGRADR